MALATHGSRCKEQVLHVHDVKSKGKKSWMTRPTNVTAWSTPKSELAAFKTRPS